MPEIEIEPDPRSEAFFKDVIRHPSLSMALLAVMMEVDYIQKKKSPGLNYTFLAEADVCEYFHEAMVKHGVTVSPVASTLEKTETYTTKTQTVMNRTIIKTFFEFEHAFTGQTKTCAMLGEGADVGDKSLPKALTCAYKYLFRQSNVLETGDDPDITPSENQAKPGEQAPDKPGSDRSPEKQYWDAKAAILDAPSLELLEKYIRVSRKKIKAEFLPHLEKAYQDRLAILNPPIQTTATTSTEDDIPF